MPRIAKGGKWIYGWVIVGVDFMIQIPPVAHREYGFQPGEAMSLIRGSRTSGGFGLGREKILMHHPQLQLRIFLKGAMGENAQILLPQGLPLQPGDRYLAVRGSGYALGFIQRGPIVDEALKHPEIEVFAP